MRRWPSEYTYIGSYPAVVDFVSENEDVEIDGRC